MKLLLQLLFVLFVGLKLTELIQWNWWLVCTPAIVLTLNFIFLHAFIGALKGNRAWAVNLYIWSKSR